MLLKAHTKNTVEMMFARSALNAWTTNSLASPEAFLFS